MPACKAFPAPRGCFDVSLRCCGSLGPPPRPQELTAECLLFCSARPCDHLSSLRVTAPVNCSPSSQLMPIHQVGSGREETNSENGHTRVKISSDSISSDALEKSERDEFRPSHLRRFSWILANEANGRFGFLQTQPRKNPRVTASRKEAGDLRI